MDYTVYRRVIDYYGGGVQPPEDAFGELKVYLPDDGTGNLVVPLLTISEMLQTCGNRAGGMSRGRIIGQTEEKYA